jgi:hypothetical protein
MLNFGETRLEEVQSPLLALERVPKTTVFETDVIERRETARRVRVIRVGEADLAPPGLNPLTYQTGS